MTATRRFCRVDGCTKIVKSQGVCQAHGAKTRKCKMAECTKQAQGNFDGMCKFHFKESRVDLKAPPDGVPEGVSVYETILPESMAFVPSPENEIMPLVAHLKQGFDTNRPRGWHRNDERRARGLGPVPSSAMQLTGWERELVWMEICILSGIPQASFRHLARAWGRDKGFHTVLTQFICDRRGNVERKRRGDIERKQRVKTTRMIKGNQMEQEYEFLDDILDLEDMELPIETLDAMRGSDTDDESETERDSSGSNTERYTDPLDEHLLMVHNGDEQGVTEIAVNAAHMMAYQGAHEQNVVGASQMIHNGDEQGMMEYAESASHVMVHNGGHEQGTTEYAVSATHNDHGAVDAYAVNHVMPHNGGREQRHEQGATTQNVVNASRMTPQNGYEQGAPEQGAPDYIVSTSHVIPHNCYEQPAMDFASHMMAHITSEQAATEYPVSASHVMPHNNNGHEEEGMTEYPIVSSAPPHVMPHFVQEQGVTPWSASLGRE